MSNLFESDHPLDSPPIVGTDEEKIQVLRTWTDIISLLRSINSTVVSFENKQTLIAYIKKEVDLIDIEINNISGVVVSRPGEIPSIEQLPPGEEPPEPNVVDLTRSDQVANTTSKDIAKVPTTDVKVTRQAAPTFADRDKLQRVAGTGAYAPGYVVPESKDAPKKFSEDAKLAPTFTDLDKLRRAAGSGRWGKK